MLIKNKEEMMSYGASLGAGLNGGETIELIGDVGAGKTTLVKGIARGLAIEEDIASPSFTISREYEARDGLRLVHYDFYRLNEAGIMAEDIQEEADDPKSIVVVEWADTVHDILPEGRKRIKIVATGEDTRELEEL